MTGVLTTPLAVWLTWPDGHRELMVCITIHDLDEVDRLREQGVDTEVER